MATRNWTVAWIVAGLVNLAGRIRLLTLLTSGAGAAG